MGDIERKTAGDRLGWALSVLDESAAPVGRRLVARQTLREIAAEAEQLPGAVEELAALREAVRAYLNGAPLDEHGRFKDPGREVLYRAAGEQ
jgi:hypothetical protein